MIEIPQNQAMDLFKLLSNKHFKLSLSFFQIFIKGKL